MKSVAGDAGPSRHGSVVRRGLGAPTKAQSWRALMLKAVRLVNRIRKDEEGAALIEYTILLGIIAIAVIGFATTISGWIITQWATLCGKLTGGSC